MRVRRRSVPAGPAAAWKRTGRSWVTEATPGWPASWGRTAAGTLAVKASSRGSSALILPPVPATRGRAAWSRWRTTTSTYLMPAPPAGRPAPAWPLPVPAAMGSWRGRGRRSVARRTARVGSAKSYGSSEDGPVWRPQSCLKLSIVVKTMNSASSTQRNSASGPVRRPAPGRQRAPGAQAERWACALGPSVRSTSAGPWPTRARSSTSSGRWCSSGWRRGSWALTRYWLRRPTRVRSR